MKVVVIGGGFGGLAAIRTIYKAFSSTQEGMPEIVLIDKNSYCTMLPSLPDVVGGRVNKEHLMGKYHEVAPSKIKLVVGEVQCVNFINKTVETNNEKITYDYLVFAPGSVANFFNHQDHFIQQCHKLDCLEDAEKTQRAFDLALEKNETLNVVISGGGFTGLELATNLYHRAYEKGKKITVSMIELCDTILPMLERKRSEYVMKKMKDLGIEFITSESIVTYEEGVVTLKSGKKIENAFLCWCSGVKMGLKTVGHHQSIYDGRICVNKNMQIEEHPEVFVVGDAAAIVDPKLTTKERTVYLRRAVNFAYMQGNLSGKNILALIQNKPLKTYKIIDLGWVIPLYTTSIGEAFGQKIRGRVGIMMHYMICGVKNYTLANVGAYCWYAMKFSATRKKNR